MFALNFEAHFSVVTEKLLHAFPVWEKQRYYIIQLQRDCTTFQHRLELCPEVPLGWSINDLLLCNRSISHFFSQNMIACWSMWNLMAWQLSGMQNLPKLLIEIFTIPWWQHTALWRTKRWHTILKQFDNPQHCLGENVFYTALPWQFRFLGG